ncbi:hypothetical protein M426DRAFT_16318 [Hypoxylon sp. CI-4A]|nr:hypothetical protein M426DRAFT_16318 [Hypoxylon sp. CI-4A]
MASPLEEEAISDSASAEAQTTGSGSSSRPSFANYWKRTKAKAQNIKFVSSSLEPAGPSKDAGQSQQQDHDAQAKAQARRAQVRKAQIQHRQRKANYTKQLEMDVARLRDLIEQAGQETMLLRSQNDFIRQHLQGTIHPSLLPPVPTLSLSSAPGAPYSAPEYTVTLTSSTETLSTPVFQIERTSASTSTASLSGLSSRQETPRDAPSPTLSEAQTDHAINFILGLERICWNHFHPSYYDHENYDPEGKEHGHSLMASAIALQSAPSSVWEQIGAEKERRKQQQQQVPTPQQPQSSASASTSASTSTAPPPPPSQPFANPNTSNTSNTTSNTTTTILTSWQTPAEPQETRDTCLTLESLHGLASTLNPPDAELAPVQAWFEIERLYGVATVLDAERMDSLRVELETDVDCLHFGAVIQRVAFEAVLERVLGPLPEGAGGGW